MGNIHTFHYSNKHYSCKELFFGNISSYTLDKVPLLLEEGVGGGGCRISPLVGEEVVDWRGTGKRYILLET
jgi:hypothetical protein